MKFRIALICLFLLLVAGCEGPAEKAGAQLDSRVEAARKEVAAFNRDIQSYKQQIEELRNELSTLKTDLKQSKEELEEVRLARQKMIEDIEALQRQEQPSSAGDKGGATSPAKK